MDVNDFIDRRVTSVSNRLQAAKESGGKYEVVQTIERAVDEINRLLCERINVTEASGHSAHPLGETPFLNTKILYLLNRAEQLLDVSEGRTSSLVNGRTASSEDLIFPSVRDSVARKVFAWVLCRKGLWNGISVMYDHPGPFEALYLKVPRFLEPFARKLLPKKRRIWAYRQRKKATPVP